MCLAFLFGGLPVFFLVVSTESQEASYPFWGGSAEKHPSINLMEGLAETLLNRGREARRPGGTGSSVLPRGQEVSLGHYSSFFWSFSNFDSPVLGGAIPLGVLRFLVLIGTGLLKRYLLPI